MQNNAARYAGALLCLVLADDLSARTRPAAALPDVRLVGSTDIATGVGAEASASDAYATGKRLLAAGDLVAALAAFRTALAIDPQSADALNGVGVSYDRLGRPDLARGFYEAGLAVDPAAPALLNNYGYSLVMAGDDAAAVAQLRAAAASDDGAAAAAAKATLAALTARMADPVPAHTPVAAGMRIETTSDGEQRLTAAPAPSMASLGDAAAAVEVAAAWTAADDAALVAQLRREDAAAALAAREAATALAARDDGDTTTSSVASASPVEQVAIAVAPATARSTVTAAPPPSLILAATPADATAARRRRVEAVRVAAAVDGTAPVRDAAIESDDAELNAFVERLRQRSAAAGQPTGETRGITASFRG